MTLTAFSKYGPLAVVEKYADKLAPKKRPEAEKKNAAVPSLTRFTTQHDGIRTVKDGILRGKTHSLLDSLDGSTNQRRFIRQTYRNI